MKLFVIGNARHGKDSVCKILQEDFGLTFESSSCFCAKRAVEPWLKEKLGITYSSDEELYADRVNHRADWYNAITAYNTPDRSRLARELFEQFDVYCGLRNREELLASKANGTCDYVIWVDASARLPAEDNSSITVLKEDADYIIDNNGPEEELRGRVHHAYSCALQHVRNK
jgi:hypothetical protein